MGKVHRLVLIVLLTTLLLALPLPVSALPSARVWESFTTGTDEAFEVYGSIWYGQTFTITNQSHTINQIRILAYREGLPSTVTISIREVNAEGLPNGDDITSGTYNGNAMTNSTTGAWYGVHTTEVSFDYGKQYAIIIRAEAGDINNSVWVRLDGSAGNYTGGRELTSSNGGITWTADADDDVNFEIYGKPLIEVTQVDVFSGYMEKNDLLFAIQYYNVYTPHYPIKDSRFYFTLQLRSANGTTVLAQTVCNQWGYKPGCLYLSADNAAKLTKGAAYRIYITGLLPEAPTAFYTLTPADWRGDDIRLLDTWILNTARDMAAYYQTDMTTYTPSGEKLNDEGSVIFAIGIPGLQYVRPNMFQTLVFTPQYTPIEWTDGYDKAGVWSDVVGTKVTEALTETGDLFGVNPRDIGGLLWVIGYIVLVVLIIGTGGDAAGAALVAVPWLVGGSYLRLLDIALICVIAAIGAFLLVYRFWWGRA